MIVTSKITIDKELSALIPPLADEERQQLEANLIEHGGARDPLVVWDHGGKTILLDGHNRFEICNRLKLSFDVVARKFEGREAAADWIDRNQLGRRNLHPDAFTLLLGRRYNRQKKAAHRPENKGDNLSPLKTAEKLARQHGVNERTVLRAGKFATAIEKVKAITPDIESGVAKGIAPPRAAVVKAAALLEKNPTKAKEILASAKTMAEVIREEKRSEIIANLENIQTKKTKELAGKYDVIVIDPPWAMEKIERDVRPNQSSFDYPTMEEDELAKIQIPAAEDCHLWLWATQKFLPMAFKLLEEWNFKYTCTFVWHKAGGFQPFGLPQFNCEFALYARRGTPSFVDTKDFPVCFEATRCGHSVKPEKFYDVVRRVTAGRRVDMFSRRAIDGFDCWGQEAAE